MQVLMIAGIVGKDAVLRHTNGGDDVLNFSIAVDNGKDKDGNKRDATWFDCSVWGKRASALERHITKGLRLAVSGRPSAREHDGKAYLGLTVNDLTFMGGNQSEGGKERNESRGGGGSQQQPRESYDLNDDIPFVRTASDHEI